MRGTGHSESGAGGGVEKGEDRKREHTVTMELASNSS